MPRLDRPSRFDPDRPSDSLYCLPQVGILEVYFESPIPEDMCEPTFDDQMLEKVLALAMDDGSSKGGFEQSPQVHQAALDTAINHPNNSLQQESSVSVAAHTEECPEGESLLEKPSPGGEVEKVAKDEAPQGAGLVKLAQLISVGKGLGIGHGPGRAEGFETTELVCASLVNGYWDFSVAQIEQVMGKIRSMADKLKLLANLLPFATDLQNSALLWTWMSPYYTEHLLSKVRCRQSLRPVHTQPALQHCYTFPA